jgi:hypothetical protein
MFIRLFAAQKAEIALDYAVKDGDIKTDLQYML